MFSFKYKLVRVGSRKIHHTNESRRFYRIQATRNIPEHKVMEGDFGGYVTNKNSLSQEGSCWIGGEAQVIGEVYITDDAFIGNKALVRSDPRKMTSATYSIHISDSAKILEEARVQIVSNEVAVFGLRSNINGNSVISGKAFVKNIEHISDSSIYGEAKVDGLRKLTDNSEIYGKAVVNKGAYICDNSKIYDKVVLEENVWIQGSVISGEARILKDKKVAYGKIEEGTIISAKQYISDSTKEKSEPIPDTLTKAAKKPVNAWLPLSPKSDLVSVTETKKLQTSVETPTLQTSVALYQELCTSIESYTTDIVKIIKYPVMTDRTDDYTLKMMISLKAVQRIDAERNPEAFNDAVFALEEAFMRAESNAEKIASSLLSDADKKKTAKAKDLFRIASDEAAAEQERKSAFVQGFKQLEGVIAVPEIAVDTFRVKLGLKEIES